VSPLTTIGEPGCEYKSQNSRVPGKVAALGDDKSGRYRYGEVTGSFTIAEILHQPQLWPTSVERVQSARKALPQLTPRKAIVSGAGTSAYAASAIAASLKAGAAIPTTELLSASRDDLDRAVPEFGDGGVLVSIARSGNSPESMAVVDRFGAMYPSVRHLAITCNAEGQLARRPGVQALLLDPRTNDQSLAMTSSFSNLTLAGLSLAHSDQLAAAMDTVCNRAAEVLPNLRKVADELASTAPSRVVILASGSLLALGSEAALKILEMTGGQTMALPESFLGLRHGPMSFLRSNALVLCVASSDPLKRRYEEDLLQELRKKNLGRIVAIAESDFAPGSVDVHAPPIAPNLPDFLRTPFEIPLAQLLAYSLSIRLGLDPDNPSPDGVITRVVQSFRLHEDAAGV
jgi:tagatose-6-phosphate ketose/aldose isomerase